MGSLINYFFRKSPRWGGINKLIFLWGVGGGEGGRYQINLFFGMCLWEAGSGELYKLFFGNRLK